MANVNTPFGLKPVGTLNQSGYVGRVQDFVVLASDTTAIGIGDPVKLTGTADADGIPVVTRATTSDVFAGVMVGIKPVFSDLTINYRKASTLQKVLVDTAADTIYEVQGGYDGTNATTIPAAVDVGQNYTLAFGTVDTTTGNGKTILSTTKGTNTNYNVQLLRLSPKSDNAIGLYGKWLVRLNTTQYVNATTGV